ncbi:hypothetical protein [Ktedonospora formicarum]|uniref:hypothetical protein n=1 Tax=Ktedonospora formicarum TaxID=2778364 RepID=UPI001C68BB85|nr:hypothetical protein [Ktedonospora formicarum]
MGRRQLIIEQASFCSERLPFRVHIHVDDQTPIGPSWVTTLATHLHYPLVDSFGAPITYRLRCISRKGLLLTSSRFVDVEFPSGSHFVLEPETYHTEEMPAVALDQRFSTNQADSSLRISRRVIIRSCMLAGVSLFGLGSGVTTAFAQRLLTQKPSITSTHKQATPLPSGIWGEKRSNVGKGGEAESRSGGGAHLPTRSSHASFLSTFCLPGVGLYNRTTTLIKAHASTDYIMLDSKCAYLSLSV